MLTNLPEIAAAFAAAHGPFSQAMDMLKSVTTSGAPLPPANRKCISDFGPHAERQHDGSIVLDLDKIGVGA